MLSQNAGRISDPYLPEKSQPFTHQSQRAACLQSGGEAVQAVSFPSADTDAWTGGGFILGGN